MEPIRRTVDLDERHPLVRLVAAPFVSMMLISWWLVGDMSEPGGEDYIVQIPFAQDTALWLGLLGMILGVITAADIERWRRAGVPFALNAALIAAATGAFVGWGVRGLTAKVGGANIGGGLILLAGPWIVLAGLFMASRRATAVSRARQRARRSDRTVRRHRDPDASPGGI